MFAHSVMEQVVTDRERRTIVRKAICHGAVFGAVATVLFYLAAAASQSPHAGFVWGWLGIPAGYCWFRFIFSDLVWRRAIRKT